MEFLKKCQLLLYEYNTAIRFYLVYAVYSKGYVHKSLRLSIAVNLSPLLNDFIF